MGNKRIGFTCSCFDLLHAGHIQMLREAKDQCDYLIVGLQTDPSIDRPEKEKPIQTVFERHMQLSAVKYVDEIFCYETEDDLLDILTTLNIDVRILGNEYKYKDFTGKELIDEGWHDVHFNERSHRFSSTELKNRIAKRHVIL